MLWPCMPAGERIADWVTWNLFFLWRYALMRAGALSGPGTRADAFT